MDFGTKWLKEMSPYNSMTVRQDMIRELLYRIDDETLRALLEHEKTAMISLNGARYCFFGGPK